VAVNLAAIAGPRVDQSNTLSIITYLFSYICRDFSRLARRLIQQVHSARAIGALAAQGEAK
jgi:hypothetical protein